MIESEIKELNRIVEQYLLYAKKLAEAQYEKFRVKQDKSFESDFDRQIKKLQARPPKKD